MKINDDIMATEIYHRAYIVKPKQNDLIVAVDFGQGEDVSNLIVTRLKENGYTEVVGFKRIGRAKDFKDDEIKKFLEEIENNEIEL